MRRRPVEYKQCDQVQGESPRQPYQSEFFEWVHWMIDAGEDWVLPLESQISNRIKLISNLEFPLPLTSPDFRSQIAPVLCEI
jgi:hypothetical protein